MQKMQCVLCPYIYDPGLGDQDNGVPAGTAWEDVPDTWVCPECAATKDLFEPAD